MPPSPLVHEGSSVPAAPDWGLPSEAESRRTYRDLALSLRCGLRDAAAEFSFLRQRGLRSLLKSLRAVAASDAAAGLFRQSQSVRELQVVPVLFEVSLRRIKGDSTLSFSHVLGAEPVKLKGPATDSEIVLALRVLEGCCLLCKECVSLAHRYDAVKELLDLLATRSVLEQRACLDTLIALLVDSPDNIMDFMERQGLSKVAHLLRHSSHSDELTRIKCAEFLLLCFGGANDKVSLPLFPGLREEMREHFGEDCMALISSADPLDSFPDQEERQLELSLQADRLLESLGLH